MSAVKCINCWSESGCCVLRFASVDVRLVVVCVCVLVVFLRWFEWCWCGGGGGVLCGWYWGVSLLFLCLSYCGVWGVIRLWSMFVVWCVFLCVSVGVYCVICFYGVAVASGCAVLRSVKRFEFWVCVFLFSLSSRIVFNSILLNDCCVRFVLAFFHIVVFFSNLIIIHYIATHSTVSINSILTL